MPILDINEDKELWIMDYAFPNEWRYTIDDLKLTGRWRLDTHRDTSGSITKSLMIEVSYTIIKTFIFSKKVSCTRWLHEDYIDNTEQYKQKSIKGEIIECQNTY